MDPDRLRQGGSELRPTTGHVAAAALVVVGLSASWTLLVPTTGVRIDPVNTEQVQGLVNTALQIAGAVTLFRGASRHRGRRRIAWSTIATGAAVGACGSIIWSVVLAVAGRHPNSPVSDTLFAVALALGTIGVGLLPPSDERSRRVRAVDTAILMVTALTLVWVTPVHQQADGRVVAGFETIDVYAIVTIITIMVAVGAIGRCRPDHHGEILPMSGALICSGVGMLLYASAPDGYPTASRLGDLVFTLGFVLAIAAGLRLRGPRRRHRRRGDDGTRHWIALPEVATVTTLVAITLHARSDDALVVAVALGALAVTLAIARLLQLGVEQRRLGDSLHDSADQLYREARVDGLTSLGNRLALDEHLATSLSKRARRAPEERGPIAVLFIDIDHFKRFNDALGHAVGDGLLIEVARRIVATTGPHAYRNGGDEFVAVVEGDTAHATALAAELIARFERPVVVGDHEMSASVSVGLSSSAASDDTESAEELIRRADLALYRAKELGRGTWAAFDPAVAELADLRHRLRQGLQDAADADELAVHLEPTARLRGLRLVGATAHLSWSSPTLGRLGPEVITPVAIEGGLISITATALFREVHQLLIETAGSSTDATGTPLWIGVRLERDELVHPVVTDLVTGMLDDPRVDPSRLHLEVTEATIVDDTALAVIAELSGLGVHVTVERFGTGPTSLLRLDRYPATTIRVDGTFVHGLGRRRDDTVIVTAVAGLAAELGLELSADGIDEEFQSTYLEGLGFATGRGRVIGEVIDRDAFVAGELELPTPDHLAAELSR